MKKNTQAASSYKFRIGNNIRKWRTLKEIKQKDLAGALQLSEAAVSNIENDITNITVGQLEDISLALNISIEQLLSDPHDKYRPYMQYTSPTEAQEEQKSLEKELVTAVIASLEKKDEQLHTIMQQFLRVMTDLIQQERHFLNSSKQLSSRV